MEFRSLGESVGIEYLLAFVLSLFVASPSFSQPNSPACIGAKEQATVLLEQQQEARTALGSDECSGPARSLCLARVRKISNDLSANASVIRTVCNTNFKPPPGPPPVEGWFDAMTGQPARSPFPYDLVTRAFDPDNGLPINPVLGSQVWSPPKLADPALCGGGNPWQASCTTQKTTIDNNVDLCSLSEGPLKGHANWRFAIYEGLIYWENHSYYLQDDDYSFALYRDDLAGMTKVDVDKGLYEGYLHSEFDSNETINYFHTWYWDQLHQAVDADAGKGGVLGSWDGIHIPRPSYTKTRPIFDGKEAIVMGMYGMDCAHDCGAELHPVLAFSVHVKDDLNDDIWSIFVRNWGTEGYCSKGVEVFDTGDQPFVFIFRIKRPGAVQVSSIDIPSDATGQNGTVFYGDSNNNANGIGVAGPLLIPNEGALVSFTLPPPSERGRINGMLHLKWSAAPQTTSLIGRHAAPPSSVIRTSSENEATEGAPTTPAILRMPPAQKEAIEQAYKRSSLTQSGAVKLVMRPLDSGTQAKPSAPAVLHVSDPARDQREQRFRQELRKVDPGLFQNIQ
ncbi:hypothetical protein [Ralstonia syzygii]|uniref:hypothetical protein n=1 Tax=Ralstonia syzygii TaxID=28097 RepID=UPI00351772FF